MNYPDIELYVDGRWKLPLGAVVSVGELVRSIRITGARICYGVHPARPDAQLLGNRDADRQRQRGAGGRRGERQKSDFHRGAVPPGDWRVR